MGYFDHYEVSPFYDRLMIPIRDPYGELLSFQGRALFNYEASEKPKYYHAPFDKGRVLYGLYENAETIYTHGKVIISEGPLDVISLWEAGLPAVALMGSTFSSFQAQLIRRYTKEVVVWLDADSAGEKATSLIRGLLSPLGVRVDSVQRSRAFKDAAETWEKAGHDGIRRTLNGRR